MKYYRERNFFYLDYMKMHTIFFLLVQIIQMLETIIFINYYNWATFELLIHIFYCGVMSLCLLLLTINLYFLFLLYLSFVILFVHLFFSKYSCKFLYVFVRFYFNGEDHIRFFKLVPEPFVFFEIQ